MGEDLSTWDGEGTGVERTQGKASGQSEGNLVMMTKSGSRTDSKYQLSENSAPERLTQDVWLATGMQAAGWLLAGEPAGARSLSTRQGLEKALSSHQRQGTHGGAGLLSE